LPNLVKQDIPELGVVAGQPLPGTVSKASYPGCTCASSGGAAGGLAFAGGAGAVLGRRGAASPAALSPVQRVDPSAVGAARQPEET
jgi:hypothetical protein